MSVAGAVLALAGIVLLSLGLAEVLIRLRCRLDMRREADFDDDPDDLFSFEIGGPRE